MSSIESAITAYLGGQYFRALQYLDDNRSIEGELLLARIDTRLHKTSSALRRLRVLRLESELSTNHSVEAALLEAALLLRNNELDSADACLHLAKNGLNPTSSPDLQSEVFYVEALSHFAKQQYVLSERSSWNAVHADLDLRSKFSDYNTLKAAPIATTKARALQLVGLIRASQERYHEHYRLLREAITIIKSAPVEDVYVNSRSYVIRSYYARDLGLISDIVEFEIFPFKSWPDDLADAKVEIEQSLAYLHSLAGDDEIAERSIHAARSTSQSDIRRLSTTADAAFLARHRTDRGILRAQLASATKDADRIDWESSDFERYVLADFARELSFIDARRSLEFINRFDSISAKINPLMLIDRQSKADDDYSRAIVLIASDERERATFLLESCFKTWTEIGYRWRAALAAIDLSTLSPSRFFVDYALRESENFPKSWLRKLAVRSSERLSDGVSARY